MRTLLLGICLLSPGLAQAPPKLAFEVATIKPAEPQTAGFLSRRPAIELAGDRYNLNGMTLRFVIGRAYEVAAIYVFGEDWLDTKFDVAAKLPEGTSEKQIPQMLQALLAERFSLRIHRETRQMPIYALTVAKGGLKLKELPPDTPDSNKYSPTRIVQIGTLEYIGATGSAAGLTSPLRNRSGLTGKYEMAIDPALIYARARSGNLGRDIDDSDALSRMRQVVEPMGLEINAAKTPVEAVVVDHVEHTPASN